jgi:hypothetical protein
MKGQFHTTIKNADNVNIGIYPEEFHIHGITDEGARETNEFTITQQELCELARYWMTIYIQNEWYSAYMGSMRNQYANQNQYLRQRIENRKGEAG